MATLSSVTSWEDRDPLSPSHLNSKLNPLVANIAALNGAASGWYDVRAEFGAVGDGSADDTASILSAIAVAGQAGHRSAVVYFPTGVYRTTSPLTTTYAGVKFVGEGIYASIISSDHSRAIFEVNSNEVEFHHLDLTGSGYTYNGARNTTNVGIHTSGFALEFGMYGGQVASTGSYGVLWDANSASRSLIDGTIFRPSFATTASPRPEAAIGMRGTDSGAVPRRISNIYTDGVLFEVQGIKDLFLSNCFAHNVSMTSMSQNIFMQGVRLGTQGSPTTLTGITIDYFGGGHAGNVVLDANAQGCTVVTSTVSGVIDLAAPGVNLVIGGVYGNTGLGFRAALSHFLGTRSTADATNGLLPTFAFSSETSLGLYRSEASVIAQSFGAFSVPGFRSSLTIKTGNYTATKQDQTVSVNSSSTVTITLPAPSTVTGQLFDVQRLGTQTVVVNATSGASLNNNSTMTLATQFESVTFQSYGSGYLAK
jgi:hypothetical protein